jgi:hypothetical protein
MKLLEGGPHPGDGTMPDCLMVRVGREDGFNDVDPDSDGFLYPGGGGLSVAPNDPFHLPDHRRPKGPFRGTGRHPIWAIAEDVLPEELDYRQYPPTELPPHGVIEPSAAMLVDMFQMRLVDTRNRWEGVPDP